MSDINDELWRERQTAQARDDAHAVDALGGKMSDHIDALTDWLIARGFNPYYKADLASLIERASREAVAALCADQDKLKKENAELEQCLKELVKLFSDDLLRQCKKIEKTIAQATSYREGR